METNDVEIMIEDNPQEPIDKGKKVLVDESFLPEHYKADGEDDGFKPISHKKIKTKKKQNNKAGGQKQHVDRGMRKFFEEMGGLARVTLTTPRF